MGNNPSQLFGQFLTKKYPKAHEFMSQTKEFIENKTDNHINQIYSNFIGKTQNYNLNDNTKTRYLKFTSHIYQSIISAGYYEIIKLPHY